MNLDKLFIVMNILLSIVALLTLFLFLGGTQIWYELSKPLYDAYVWYFANFISLSYLLFLMPLGGALILYRKYFPCQLLALNLSPYAVFIMVFYLGCDWQFFGAAAYATYSLAVSGLTFTIVRNIGWNPPHGELTLTLLYMWQVILTGPIMLGYLLISVFGCHM